MTTNNDLVLVNEITAEWVTLRALSPAALVEIVKVCRSQQPQTINSRLREHRALVVLRELVRRMKIDRVEVDGRLYRFEEDERGDFEMVVELKEGA